MKPRPRAIRVTDAGKRELPICSYPDICGGEPLVRASVGNRSVVPATELLDRIDAGQSIEELAKEFSCDPGSLELLVELREAIYCKPVEVEASEMVDATVDLWVSRLQHFEARLRAEIKSRMQRSGRNSSVILADVEEAIEKAKAEITAVSWDPPTVEAERDRLRALLATDGAEAVVADLEEATVSAAHQEEKA